MSVLKSKREESTVLFLDNAIDLHVYTLKQCIKFPKIQLWKKGELYV